MPDLGYTFNPMEHEPQGTFEPIPPDDYEVMVVDTDVATTAAGTGSYLKVELEVVSGEYTRRKIFDQITLTNQNTQAEEIGARQLSALSRACGVIDAYSNSDVFHGQTLRARIGIEPERTDPKSGRTYGPRNKVTTYLIDDDAAAAPATGGGTAAAKAPPRAAAKPAASAPAAAPAAKAAAGGKRPWER